ncbi:MAG: sensor histidine kinase [Phycisphaerales bacterium]
MTTPQAPSIPIEIDAKATRAPMLSERDLAELLTSFNEVTSKLQATHETLRAEVSRLQRELHDANEALRRSERLAALGEMAAGIAHEIRNPLAGIGLYANMLVSDLGDRPECKGVAQKIANGVRGLDAIVGDVLTFAKRIEPRLEPCAVGDLLDRVIDVCAPQIDRAGAAIERVDAADANIECACDHGLMQQALVNVVRNAAEALAEMPESARPATPRIRIAAERRTVRDRDGARPMICLAVADNGPGIPEDVRGRMFNPFFTTRHTGTGLGLAIVHRIVDAHGGSVRVSGAQSGKARGTTIEILLPDTNQDAPGRHETERAE